MADVTVLGDDFRGYPQKFKDMGDGTYARVFYSGTPSGGSDKTIVGRGHRSLPRKLHDSGDGTFALIRVGG